MVQLISCKYNIKGVAMWSGLGNSKSQVLPSNSATWKWSGVETEVGTRSFIRHRVDILQHHFALTTFHLLAEITSTDTTSTGPDQD